jgi:imidazoleglycerol-phosphate dehydratase/histidinol-phosphatase
MKYTFPRRLLILDRDGTLIDEPEETKQVDRLDLLKMIPGAVDALTAIVGRWSYDLILITNQDGLGTSVFPEATFWPAQQKMMNILSEANIHFKDILIDRSLPEEQAPTRKPATGLMEHYLDNDDYDLARSIVIGDRLTDVELAYNLGARSIYLNEQPLDEASLTFPLRPTLLKQVSNWTEIVDVIGNFQSDAKVEV